MAAFIPSRRDPEVNEIALTKVREDKVREAGDGFDGTWVAHPDLVPVATAVFDEVLADQPNQLGRLRADVSVEASALLDVAATPGQVTEDGLRVNVNVGILYIESWLRGTGAAAIYNLMEDAATAEISRSQVWQWVRHGRFTRDDVGAIIDEELEKIRGLVGAEAFDGGRFDEARRVFEEVALADDFADFLTLPAYELL
jgi:malate synthase